MHTDIFRKRQPVILFGACTDRTQGAQNTLGACLEASEAEADFFGCQLALTADNHLVTAMENACAVIQKTKGASWLRTMTRFEAQRALGNNIATLEELIALADRLDMPLALFVPDHVTASDADRRAFLSAFQPARSAKVPLMLASSDTDLFTLCRTACPGAPWATGLVIAACHTCDVTALVRDHKADMCVLPKELATDCRLCGLRETKTYTLIVGEYTLRDILRVSISGADGFMVTQPGPLLTAFRRK